MNRNAYVESQARKPQAIFMNLGEYSVGKSRAKPWPYTCRK